MYKQLRIISSETLGNEIDDLLKRLGIDEYIIMSDIKGTWGEKVKHMNSHTWPGVDEVRIVVVRKEEAEVVIDAFRTMKGRLKDTLKVKVIVTTINEII